MPNFNSSLHVNFPGLTVICISKATKHTPTGTHRATAQPPPPFVSLPPAWLGFCVLGERWQLKIINVEGSFWMTQSVIIFNCLGRENVVLICQKFRISGLVECHVKHFQRILKADVRWLCPLYLILVITNFLDEFNMPTFLKAQNYLKAVSLQCFFWKNHVHHRFICAYFKGSSSPAFTRIKNARFAYTSHMSQSCTVYTRTRKARNELQNATACWVCKSG